MADATTNLSTNLVEYTVSELSFALKRTVEEAYGLVKLRGEISNFNGQHSSGHCYFKLKDEDAVIDALIWRSTFQRLKFKPEQGLEVVVKGRVTTYPNKSTYQIVIDDLEPAGIGALMALLEQRKRALAAEGLFDAARKLPLPYPCSGLAGQGAGRDLRRRGRRRHPRLQRADRRRFRAAARSDHRRARR